MQLARSSQLTRLRDPERYLKRTAANTLKDYYRYEIVRRRFLQAHAAEPEDAECALSPERVYEDEESLEAALSALRGLSFRTQEVMLLRAFAGWRQPEIARHFGISLAAVEKHVTKAMKDSSRGPRMRARD